MYPNTIVRTVPISAFKYCDNLNNTNGSGWNSFGLKYKLYESKAKAGQKLAKRRQLQTTVTLDKKYFN